MSYKINASKYITHSATIGLLLTAAFAVSACNTRLPSLGTSQTYNEGYVIDPQALETIPVGSSRDQVLLALGSPSTKAMYDNEVFYYISQTRYRGAQFMKSKVVDRKILAIYFNKQGQIAKIAHYGLKDGRLFDFISRTTPTGGKDRSFLHQLVFGTKAVPGGLPTTSR